MKKSLDLTIAGFHELEMLGGTDFTHVISIHDASLQENGGYESRIKGYFPKARILFSYFDDVEYLTQGGPDADIIDELLYFSRPFVPADKILIHCRAGISRSTALAYAILCQHTQPGQEGKALTRICQLRPQLLPNRFIIELADHLLHRDGKMIEVAKERRWQMPL